MRVKLNIWLALLLSVFIFCLKLHKSLSRSGLSPNLPQHHKTAKSIFLCLSVCTLNVCRVWFDLDARVNVSLFRKLFQYFWSYLFGQYDRAHIEQTVKSYTFSRGVLCYLSTLISTDAICLYLLRLQSETSHQDTELLSKFATCLTSTFITRLKQ